MQGNEELKKRQILSAQIDLSKFNKGDFIKATEEEKKQQDVMGESTTFFKDGMKTSEKESAGNGKYCDSGSDSGTDHYCTVFCTIQLFGYHYSGRQA